MMPIETRIQKLEDQASARARLLVSAHPRNMTDEQLEDYLNSRGISTQTDDLVVSLKRFREGRSEPWVMTHKASA